MSQVPGAIASVRPDCEMPRTPSEDMYDVECCERCQKYHRQYADQVLEATDRCEQACR